MTLLEMLDLAVAHRASPAHSRTAFNEQAAAEPDAAMNLDGRDLNAVFTQGPLPGDGMGIHGINQCAVQVEDQGFHAALNGGASDGEPLARARGSPPAQGFVQLSASLFALLLSAG